MKCNEQGCGGEIDFEHELNARGYHLYPCNKCGRLHRPDGSPEFRGPIGKSFRAFLINGLITYKDDQGRTMV